LSYLSILELLIGSLGYPRLDGAVGALDTSLAGDELDVTFTLSLAGEEPVIVNALSSCDLLIGVAQRLKDGDESGSASANLLLGQTRNLNGLTIVVRVPWKMYEVEHLEPVRELNVEPTRAELVAGLVLNLDDADFVVASFGGSRTKSGNAFECTARNHECSHELFSP
jgi:hypothetical protein|tara:strand:- start:211 stop:714 length:504 start_codon:yes stop_codon:yes gene_type:complete